MAISGQSSTRMLARHTHPTEERKIGALSVPWLSTKRAHDVADDAATDSDIAELLRNVGGRQGDRTPDLCIANARRTEMQAPASKRVRTKTGKVR